VATASTIRQAIRETAHRLQARRTTITGHLLTTTRLTLICSGLASIAHGCGTITPWLGWIALGFGLLIVEQVIAP
jgi:hypothetical protein